MVRCLLSTKYVYGDQKEMNNFARGSGDEELLVAVPMDQRTALATRWRADRKSVV